MKLDENNYVELAEQAILALKKAANSKPGRSIPVVTTSKIRNLLAMANEIYYEVQNVSGEKLPDEVKGRINYLKIRIVYEAGREPTVKKFVEVSELLGHLDEVKGSRRQYILFHRYMEALVAYRKFHVEKDD